MFLLYFCILQDRKGYTGEFRGPTALIHLLSLTPDYLDIVIVYSSCLLRMEYGDYAGGGCRCDCYLEGVKAASDDDNDPHRHRPNKPA